MSRTVTEAFEAERVTILEVRRVRSGVEVGCGLLVRDGEGEIRDGEGEIPNGLASQSSRADGSLEGDLVEAAVLPARRTVCRDGPLSSWPTGERPTRVGLGADDETDRTKMPRGGALRDLERRVMMLCTEASSSISESRESSSFARILVSVSLVNPESNLCDVPVPSSHW